MSRCSCLIDIPPSTKRDVRYSSSSGFVGRSPIKPKLLGVSTMPVPMCQRHTRLTMTRAVIG